MTLTKEVFPSDHDSQKQLLDKIKASFDKETAAAVIFLIRFHDHYKDPSQRTGDLFIEGLLRICIIAESFFEGQANHYDCPEYHDLYMAVHLMARGYLYNLSAEQMSQLIQKGQETFTGDFRPDVLTHFTEKIEEGKVLHAQAIQSVIDLLK